jgi:dTDP-4-amino-4,6-dideoxygalactose transaminase
VKAVLPVHLRGDVCDLPALKALASGVGAVLVEDAPHALGSVGTFDGVAHPVGDGAYSALRQLLVPPGQDPGHRRGRHADHQRRRPGGPGPQLRGHGMVRPAGAEPWVYEMPELGFNYRIPDVLCALGISQLAKLDRFVARRRTLTALYAEKLAALAPTRAPGGPAPPGRPGPAPADRADRLRGRRARPAGGGRGLKAQGVGSQVHYIPVHRQPYYQARYGALTCPAPTPGTPAA